MTVEHEWELRGEAEASHFVCAKCGLTVGPRFSGSAPKDRGELSSQARCFGSPELTADIVRRALEETGYTLYFRSGLKIPWQEMLGGPAIKGSALRVISQPDMIALWLGINGNMIVWDPDMVTLTHPSTHQLPPSVDLFLGSDPDYGVADCHAKCLPRNPTEETGWGAGFLVWIKDPSVSI